MDPISFAAGNGRRSARRLANLANIPAAIITTGASYHAVYDHCTAKYLAQAGIPVTAFRLGDQGIHGNAHMVMLEKNNLQVAGLIARCRFRARAASILPVRFVADSLLEGDGFELVVPRHESP